MFRTIMGAVLLLTIAGSLAIHPRDLRAESVPGTINVKDYGAKGDGVTDDTIALQTAFDEQYRRQRNFNLGHWQSTCDEIIIPEGTYVVSNMVRISNAVVLRGEGNVVLRSTNTSLPVMDVHWALRVVIENITFEGGTKSLHLFTANSAGAHIRIRNCTFRGSSDFAISCVMKGVYANNQFIYSGNYKQTKIRDHEYQYEYFEGPGHNYIFNSTVIHIEGCRFEKCMKVFHSNADMASLDSCYIETHPDMKGAAIVAGGLTKLENIEGLAHVTDGNEQRWVDHIPCGLISRKLKLKTAGDKGMCVIYALTKFRDTSAGGAQFYLTIDDSEFEVAGSPENSIVYCKEVPNTIAIRDCKETTGEKVNAVGFEKVPDESYFRKENGRPAISPDGLKYVVDARNSKNIDTALPASMTPYVDRALPDEIAELFSSKTPIVTREKMKSFIKRRVNLSDFGAVGDGKTDDTEAFRKAAASVAEMEHPEIIISPGHYLVTGTIVLPPEISIRAIGSAYVFGTDKESLFRISGARRVSFHNLIIGHYENAISITSVTDAEALVLIDRCIFGDITGMAIRSSAADMKPGEKNDLHFRITDSSFSYHVRQLFETNASDALFDNSWAVTDENMVNAAAIVNKGVLYCNNIAGNPCSDNNQKDQRWIDNYDTIITDNFRFGGEVGGICLVNQCSRRGHVLLQNGWLYALGNAKRPASVYLQQVPGVVALRTNTGCNGGIQTMFGASRAARATRGAARGIFTSGNTIPVNDPFKETE